MGEVHRALDTRLDRAVAIKVLSHRPRQRSAQPRAVRARGPRDFQAHPSAHLHDSRCRFRAGRRPGRALSRDGVAGRGDACGTPAQGAGAGRTGDQDRARNRRGARRRARRGHRPSGPEARQHHAHEVGREAARFRTRTSAQPNRRRRHVLRRVIGFADSGWPRLRNGPVHGARTGERRRSGRTHRSVCVWRSVLRNADRTAGIQRRLRAGAHCGHPRAGSSSPHQPTAASTSGARASGERVSGEGSGRTLAAYAGPPAGSSRHRRRPHAGGFGTTSRVLDILRSHWPRRGSPDRGSCTWAGRSRQRWWACRCGRSVQHRANLDRRPIHVRSSCSWTRRWKAASTIRIPRLREEPMQTT